MHLQKAGGVGKVHFRTAKILVGFGHACGRGGKVAVEIRYTSLSIFFQLLLGFVFLAPFGGFGADFLRLA